MLIRRLVILLIVLFLCHEGSAQYVYKTPSGAKYHLSSCRMVENTSRKLTIEEALKLGLEACKICKPPAASQQVLPATSSKPAAGRKPATTQCLGRTKAGTRCKHMTSIANGYCFQHDPNKDG